MSQSKTTGCPRDLCDHSVHVHQQIQPVTGTAGWVTYGSCAVCTSQKRQGEPGEHPCAAADA